MCTLNNVIITDTDGRQYIIVGSHARIGINHNGDKGLWVRSNEAGIGVELHLREVKRNIHGECIGEQPKKGKTK